MKKRHKLKFLACLACSVLVCVVLLSHISVVQANDNVAPLNGREAEMLNVNKSSIKIAQNMVVLS